MGSEFGNCTILDKTKNLAVQLNSKENHLDIIDDNWKPESHLSDHDYFESDTNITKFIEDTSHYIAGFVVKKISKLIQCSTCLASLTTNSTNSSILISIKNRGGLIFPSKSVVLVCQEVERIIRSHPPTYFNNDKNKLYLLTKVKLSRIYIELIENYFTLALIKNHFWINIMTKNHISL